MQAPISGSRRGRALEVSQFPHRCCALVSHVAHMSCSSKLLGWQLCNNRLQALWATACLLCNVWRPASLSMGLLRCTLSTIPEYPPPYARALQVAGQYLTGQYLALLSCGHTHRISAGQMPCPPGSTTGLLSGSVYACRQRAIESHCEARPGLAEACLWHICSLWQCMLAGSALQSHTAKLGLGLSFKCLVAASSAACSLAVHACRQSVVKPQRDASRQLADARPRRLRQARRRPARSDGRCSALCAAFRAARGGLLQGAARVRRAAALRPGERLCYVRRHPLWIHGCLCAAI